MSKNQNAKMYSGNALSYPKTPSLSWPKNLWYTAMCDVRGKGPAEVKKLN